MILYVSDLDMKKSGYMNLGVKLAQAMTEHDRVLYLGWDYKREEHPYDFTAIPLTGLQHIAPIADNLKPKMVCVALDIPLHTNILKDLDDRHSTAYYTGIFPIEARPLSTSWASWLWKMNSRFVLSQHGLRACEEEGLSATFLPIPFDIGDNVDGGQWKRAAESERELSRDFMNLNKKFVVLTVADNHERKNLVKGMEMVAELVKRGIDVHYFIVTRLGFAGGYDLEDLKIRFGLSNRVTLMNRGLPHDKLWALYTMADAFLLPSKAEGAGLPVLEAMLVGVPVVGTNIAAIEDHLADGRGFPVDYDYKFIDPFGNSERVFVDVNHGVSQLERVANLSPEEKKQVTDLAYEYVCKTYNDKNTIEILNRELKEVW